MLLLFSGLKLDSTTKRPAWIALVSYREATKSLRQARRLVPLQTGGGPTVYSLFADESCEEKDDLQGKET